MAKRAFEFVSDTLTPALGKLDDAGDRFLTAVMGRHAPLAEAYAKQNAPWVDQTTNARNGLFAKPEFDRPSYRIIIGHAVPYGIWLEVRFAGRYAILEPTVRTQGIEVMKTIQAGYMRGLIGGI